MGEGLTYKIFVLFPDLWEFIYILMLILFMIQNFALACFLQNSHYLPSFCLLKTAGCLEWGFLIVLLNAYIMPGTIRGNVVWVSRYIFNATV